MQAYSRNKGCKHKIEDLFYQLINRLIELNEIDVENEYNIYLKICGNRNSYSKTDKDATFMRMDAGYESEENYEYIFNNNYTPYIKPQNYEKQKTRKFKQNISKAENITTEKGMKLYKLVVNYVLREIRFSNFLVQLFFV